MLKCWKIEADTMKTSSNLIYSRTETLEHQAKRPETKARPLKIQTQDNDNRRDDSSARPQTVLLENAIKFPQWTGCFSIFPQFLKLFDMKAMQNPEKQI